MQIQKPMQSTDLSDPVEQTNSAQTMTVFNLQYELHFITGLCELVVSLLHEPLPFAESDQKEIRWYLSYCLRPHPIYFSRIMGRIQTFYSFVEDAHSNHDLDHHWFGKCLDESYFYLRLRGAHEGSNKLITFIQSANLEDFSERAFFNTIEWMEQDQMKKLLHLV